ncbi:hypothetical protein [Polaromonas jejuensis]|uniref:Transmembrane protein n=1 Tax=Polaromonas jejuensis TaxID=457502 RepID=A0ABW0QF41_9BURK|nr:hypothetical protein [Polaromonas jejuensis]
MKPLPQHWRLWLASAALAWLGLLALPAARHWLEAGMSTHMLIQYPLIALAGFLLVAALPTRWRLRLSAWNAYGISGLFATALILAILMIPRLLDLALLDGRIELAKWLALLACGAAVRLSWQPAGWLVQGFFLGNVLPMMAVVGTLFESSPVRVCNAYLLDDQERLGQRLVWTAAAIGLVWFASLVRTLMRREAAAVLPAPSNEGPATTESRAPGSH